MEKQAKQELIRIAYNDSWTDSYNAINTFKDKYGKEIESILANVFVNNRYRPTKALALEKLLDYNYPSLDQIMREQLVIDSEMTTEIAQSLLEYYPTIQNYKYIADHLDQIRDSLYKETVSYTLMGFEVPKPDSLKSVLDMINVLIDLTDTTYKYNLLGDLTFKNEIQQTLNSGKVNLKNVDSLNCAKSIKEFQDSVDYVFKDSLNSDPRFITLDGWKFLYYNAQNILDRLPAIPEETTANLTVKLTNSTGSLLTGGSLQYYEGSWKDAVNNGDGTFAVNTDKQSLSLRMTYEYGTQTVSNVPAQNNTFTFQTVNTVVQLKNSQGNLINEEGTATSGAGQVKYYAGAWRDFGTTVNGVASKELLPNNYSFRMSYAYGSNDKQQDIGTNSTVVFQTVNANVQLQNSAGTLDR